MIVLPVRGMHCASCVAKVEKALGSLSGVEEVLVDLPSRTVAVRGTPDVAELRKAIERAGYDVLGAAESRADAESVSLKAQREEQAVLLKRLAIAAVLSLPLMFGFGLSPYTQLLIAIPLVVFGGWHFHEGLVLSLLRKTSDMNTLVSLSTGAALFYSAWVVILPETLPPAARLPQWDAVAGLVTLVTLGRYLEARTHGKTNEALLRLMRIAPKTARALRGGKEAVVPLSEIEPGDTVLVRPGEQVGLDGVVLEGASTIDESLLTGESLPVEKSKGSRVFGGTLNKTGALVIRVERPGSESALARIIEAVRAAQATKPRIQRFVDRVAGWFVPAVLLLGTTTALLWALYGPEPRAVLALTCLVSVFAAACPCALGLATPLALIAGMGRAAEIGVFIRNADVLEEVARVDVVLFDKTGTLTEGKPRVISEIVLKGSPMELREWALAAEQRSEHPLAEAVVEACRSKGAKPPAVDSFEAVPGRGVLARVRGREVRVGSPAWLGVTASFPGEHRTLLAVSVDGELLGGFVLADTLRPSAPAAVQSLKDMGIEVCLVSGDREGVARLAAEQAGIGTVFAEVLPEEKARIVERFKAEGKTVAMVGEGFNDAPALSAADIGIALANGTDVAVEAADITLMRPDLAALVEAIRLCQRIRRVIWQNLFWAFAYNIVLLPIAAGALYPRWGILLKPHFAATAMALSSISVVMNSWRLRKPA
jgi:Cu+-exporting ATPase